MIWIKWSQIFCQGFLKNSRKKIYNILQVGKFSLFNFLWRNFTNTLSIFYLIHSDYVQEQIFIHLYSDFTKSSWTLLLDINLICKIITCKWMKIKVWETKIKIILYKCLKIKIHQFIVFNTMQEFKKIFFTKIIIYFIKINTMNAIFKELVDHTIVHF